jgi:hypothetical protein
MPRQRSQGSASLPFRRVTMGCDAEWRGAAPTRSRSETENFATSWVQLGAPHDIEDLPEKLEHLLTSGFDYRPDEHFMLALRSAATYIYFYFVYFWFVQVTLPYRAPR